MSFISKGNFSLKEIRFDEKIANSKVFQDWDLSANMVDIIYGKIIEINFEWHFLPSEFSTKIPAPTLYSANLISGLWNFKYYKDGFLKSNLVVHCCYFVVFSTNITNLKTSCNVANVMKAIQWKTNGLPCAWPLWEQAAELDGSEIQSSKALLMFLWFRKTRASIWISIYWKDAVEPSWNEHLYISFQT